MSRKLSSIAPDWWDYTTLDAEIIRDAAALTPEKMLKLSRPGFKVVFFETLEEFYLAEALEYIAAWKQSTSDNPVGVCGPIGPTEQLPLVARLVNDLKLKIQSAHFWGMDEWFLEGREAPPTHPLSFERADRELCFNRIRKEFVMPDANLHFPKADTQAYRKTWNCGVRCAVMQGGQGDIKHWAFNDPPRRKGIFKDQPPSPAEFLKLQTRVVDLHPLTIAQNARTSGGGNISLVPTQAISVGPVETWQAEKVSIWQAGNHDNPFGQRLTTLMIAKRIPDAAVPMSLWQTTLMYSSISTAKESARAMSKCTEPASPENPKTELKNNFATSIAFESHNMKEETSIIHPRAVAADNFGALSRRSFLRLGATVAGAGAALAPSVVSAERDWSGAEPERYPDSRIVVLDDRFSRYKANNAAIQRLWTGAAWAEGCAWNAGGRYLIWSDIPNNRQLRRVDEDGHVSVFRNPSNNTNGSTFDFEGRLFSCEHNTRRVVRFEHNGSISVLADQWNGKPLNAPNDIVVHPDGSIWFTDPGYGIMGSYEGHKANLELKEAIYRIDAKTAKMEMVTDEGYKPNGLCFSPDYLKLYVADTGGPAPRGIDIYDVDGAKLKNRRRFCSMELNGKFGSSDGIRADTDGNIWSAAGWVGEGYDGVHIFAPDGQRIGMILLPEVCANLCFGGEKRNRLFMAASQSLYAVYVEAKGAHVT